MPKYELPDPTVAKVWCSRVCQYPPIAWNHHTQRWEFVIGRTTKDYQPPKGDWLPWTPPVFPERVKIYRRRCWATVSGKRVAGYLLRDREFYGLQGGCWNPSQVTDIDWIDPEYLDELPPDPRKESA